MSNLQQENAIAGALVISPPDNPHLQPSQWFRRTLADRRGTLLDDYEKLSKRLPAPIYGKIFVFILDQIENYELNDYLKCFLKTLAEDSDRVKSYVVIATCSDAAMAATMWEWNGRQKIILLGDDGEGFSTCKWTEREVDEWLGKYQSNSEVVKKLFNENRKLFASFRLSAVVAGTPGFLASNAPKGHGDIRPGQDRIWRDLAKECSEQWKSGLELFQRRRG